MPFIPSNRQSPAEAFGQGWNATMNLFGKKMIAEREKRMEDQFNKQFASQEKKYAEDAKVRSLSYKSAQEQLKSLEFSNKLSEKKAKLWENQQKNIQAYKTEIEALRESGKLDSKTHMQVRDKYISEIEGLSDIKEYYKPEAEYKPPAAIQEYEVMKYGALNPLERGLPSYKAGYLQFIREKKEESPYVDALVTNTIRTIKAQAKTQGGALRKEFNQTPDVKQFDEFRLRNDVMQRALQEAEKVETLQKGNLVAVDQAVITTFNKMTDPDSVVRESEYARTANDLALWSRIKGKVEKWKRGGAGLTIDDRRALAYMANQFYDVAEGKYKERLSEYHDYIGAYDLDPEAYIKTPTWLKEKTKLLEELDKEME